MMYEDQEGKAQAALARLFALRDEGGASALVHAFVRPDLPPTDFRVIVLGATEHDRIIDICDSEFGFQCRCLPIKEDFCVSQGTPLQATEQIVASIQALLEWLETIQSMIPEEPEDGDPEDHFYDEAIDDDTEAVHLDGDEDHDGYVAGEQILWREANPDAWRGEESENYAQEGGTEEDFNRLLELGNGPSDGLLDEDEGDLPIADESWLDESAQIVSRLTLEDEYPEVALSFPGFCVIVMWFGSKIDADPEITFTCPASVSQRAELALQLAVKLSLSVCFREYDFGPLWRAHPDGAIEEEE